MNSVTRTISLSLLLAFSLAIIAVPAAQAEDIDARAPVSRPPAAASTPASAGGAAAASTTGAPQIQLQSWFKDINGQKTTLKSLIKSTIPNFLISFVGLVFIVFFLVSAVRYLIGAGNTESTTSAKHGMLSAIIGIIVVLVAFGAVTMVNKWISATP